MTKKNVGADEIEVAKQALACQQARLAEIRDDIAETDAAEREATTACALAVAEGESEASETIVESRQALRTRLGDLHAAVVVVERRIEQAERTLDDAQARKTRGEYARARTAEIDAAHKVQHATEALSAAIEKLLDAQTTAYGLGLSVKAESAAQRNKRQAVLELFIQSQLDSFLPDFRVQNARRVENLPERLGQVLPRVTADEPAPELVNA